MLKNYNSSIKEIYNIAQNKSSAHYNVDLSSIMNNTF